MSIDDDRKPVVGIESPLFIDKPFILVPFIAWNVHDLTKGPHVIGHYTRETEISRDLVGKHHMIKVDILLRTLIVALITFNLTYDELTYVWFTFLDKCHVL